MGYYINPGNENFKVIRNDEYIDKSGIISAEFVVTIHDLAD